MAIGRKFHVKSAAGMRCKATRKFFIDWSIPAVFWANLRHWPQNRAESRLPSRRRRRVESVSQAASPRIRHAWGGISCLGSLE